MIKYTQNGPTRLVFTDTVWKYFSLIPFKVRAAMAESKAYVPFYYEDESFYNFDHDPMQQRVELFKTLSEITKKRRIRPVLRRFGIHPNRYYLLKDRYMMYGVWGLVDLFQISKIGEKISPDLELQIIEERLMDPSLSTARMIKKLNLQCSKANVQKIYTKWKLSRFRKLILIREVISQRVPEKP